MTKINKLVMSGFKSFANRTELVFGDKFNCILGPNGAGKSNVGDAICFVLGRLGSKSLRAEKTANLIFNGGKKKKPADKGEVHIYFDNSSKVFPADTPEVKVSRFIKKNGLSVYKINDKTHTRNEVVDLLGAARIDPDGFNIILQGDIVRFVEMSPLERRQVVESISGISVYEERKHKALLELDKVEKRLGEADIVLNERKTHLKELKKDRDQALKFKELKESVDSNKATYVHIQMEKRNAIKNGLDTEVTKLQEKLKKAEEQVAEYKQIVQQKKDEIQKINDDIEQKGEVEQKTLNKDVENLRVALEKQKTRVEMIKDELAKIKLRKQSLDKGVRESDKSAADLLEKKKELEGIHDEKKKELAEVEKKIEDFKKRNKLDHLGDVERSIEAADKDSEKKQEEIQKIRGEQQELLREKDKLEYQVQNLDQQVQKVAEIEKANKKQLDELKTKKSRFTQVTLELNKALEFDSSTAAKTAETRKQLAALNEDKTKLDARRASAQERVAGDIAVKKILAFKGKKPGIYGTISELGKVEKKYSMALEIAAGQRLMSIVVEDEKIAAEHIKYLRDNKFGVATFIPLNRIKTPVQHAETKELLKEKGVHGLAAGIVEFDQRFRKAFEYVFGETLIVDDLETARRIGIGKARMVTLEGDLCDYSGVMRGGFYTKRSGAFMESDTAKDIEAIEKKLVEGSIFMDSLVSGREKNEKRIFLLRQEKMALEVDVAKLEKLLHLATGDIEATKLEKDKMILRLKEVDAAISSVSDRIANVNKELAALKSRKEQMKSQVSQLRNPHLLAELSAFEEMRVKAKESILETGNKIENAGLQIAQMVLPEKERIIKLIKGHEKEETAFLQEMNELQAKIKSGEAELKQKDKVLREFFSAYKELFSTRDKLSAEVNSAEDKTESVREQSRKVEIEMNNISLKLASVKSELAGLQTQFDQFRDARILKGKTEEELKLEIGRFERMLESMSAVNMKALEIYEQVEAEYGKLLEKKETLLVEQTSVVSLMDEIEGKKKEQFMKTFDEINKNFQAKFSMLSRKGNAYLQLENPDKVFDAGLDIRVRIVGQRYLDIRGLSGGEKTMTALAFIFAIQEHQPHSFYILDEVDAALDKHNSEKLAQLIRQYCNNAQYLIISHNDSLISEADNLYGISMDEFSVSKVVSLKV